MNTEMYTITVYCCQIVHKPHHTVLISAHYLSDSKMFYPQISVSHHCIL